MRLKRASGVLLHPTSLPGGRLGEEAYRFVDWLAAAGQSWWQVLPLGPPDTGGSPYNAASAFAGSPAAARRAARARDAPRTSRTSSRGTRSGRGDWAAFAGKDALADQVRFDREWSALRDYARERGVRIFGDVPIYVAAGSAEHVAHPELFARGEVAGAPPDSYSATGQHWGNPLYDWRAHRATGYRWWIERFRRTFELVDLARIDHFRGFVAYWAIPERHKTAQRGRWRAGPGAEPFDAARAALGDAAARRRGPRRDHAGGRAAAQAARLARAWSSCSGRSAARAATRTRLENHEEQSVVYTSTHDTDTARGWFDSLPKRERDATPLDPREPHWSLIELAHSSRAALSIVPAQDVLGLGSAARMNTPGRAAGNWRWRLRRGQLTDELAARLRESTARGDRLST